jgi:MFS transporter, ACS family, glucarate transporter
MPEPFPLESRAEPPATHVHWQVIALLFVLSFLTIVDRVAISAAKNDMARDLGISDVTFGFVFGVFALGYAIFQVPSGWCADRFGPKRFMALIVLLWSLFTGLTGLVAGAAALIAIRFLFGSAESGIYPTATRAIYNWVPRRERGTAQGILFIGSRLGAAFGLSAVSLSIVALGWRTTFLLLTAVGVLLAAYWLVWFRDHPREKTGVSESELAYIGSEPEPPRKRDAKTDWRGLLLTRNVVLLMYQYFASNFTFFIAFTWFLPYLRDHYQLTAAEAGAYASVPLYFGALANWAGGVAVDYVYRRGHWRLSRLAPAIAGFGVASVALVAATWMPSVQGAVACFALATFGVDLTLSPSWTACSDIAGRHTGTLSGAMNMIGNFGSFVSSITFPYLLTLTKSAAAYFWLAALLNVVAILCWLGVRPDLKRIKT